MTNFKENRKKQKRFFVRELRTAHFFIFPAPFPAEEPDTFFSISE